MSTHIFSCTCTCTYTCNKSFRSCNCTYSCKHGLIIPRKVAPAIAHFFFAPAQGGLIKSQNNMNAYASKKPMNHNNFPKKIKLKLINPNLFNSEKLPSSAPCLLTPPGYISEREQGNHCLQGVRGPWAPLTPG